MKALPRPFWLLLSVVLGATALILGHGFLAGAPQTSRVLIDSLLFDGYAINDADEAVRLANVGPAPVNVGGWRLSDGSSLVSLPPNTILPPSATLWITGDAAAFRAQFGREADVSVNGWPGFANSGDEVILLDSAGALVDVLVYLDGDPSVPGWNGSPAAPYRVSGVFAAEGQILYRRRDQLTGSPVIDTNSAADWAQWVGDPINGRKVYYPGWLVERFFYPAQIVGSGTLTIAIAPDNSYEALSGLIKGARSSIRLVSLTLENVRFGEALATAARRGVAVTVLLEGGPPGGITDQERYVCGVIEQAGGACWFMIADSGRRIHDRYRYMHAKYMIVDDRIAVIGSENFSPDSLPDDDKRDGTWGRRGVFLITDVPGVADHLGAVFASDLDLSHQDLLRWSSGHPIYGSPPPGFIPETLNGGISYTVRFPTPAVFTDVRDVVVQQSPENALRDADGLLGLLARAGEGDRLLVQQLAERPYWGSTTSNPTADPNPRLEAYIAAARRGAVVRILLDAFFDEPDSRVNNAATCAYLTEIARRELLSLRCAQGNPTGLGIHNKMVLARIDGRGYVHVGSINGTELSNKGNREVALQLQSDMAFEYLARLFEGDFPNRIYLPLTMNRYEGPPQRILISELVYDTTGPDEAEFVELANPMGVAVDLTGYAMGDATLPTDFEDMRTFPPGTTIPAHGALVVALSAVGFRAEFGISPHLEFVDSDPTVPDMIDDPSWGDPEALFQLGNSGDEVLLRRWDGLVDVVTYGDGFHSGVAGCGLLVSPARTLERYPYWRDTDVCSADFRPWPFPSPGRLP